MDSSNFWKIDKIDILFLNFVLIVFLSFNVFASDVEDVSINIDNSLYFYDSMNYFASSPTGSGARIGYFPLEKGYIYHIKFTGNFKVAYGVSPLLPQLNGLVDVVYSTSEPGSFDYLATSDDYLYFSYSWYTNLVTVTRERITDMGGVVQVLSNDVGPKQVWSIFDFAIPFVLIVVVVCLGIFIIFRLLKKGSEGEIKF